MAKKVELKIDDQIWPMERDILFRPDRLKYVRRLVKPKGCVFCTAAKAKASEKSLVLYHSRYSTVMLNKFPYNTGHLLVVPKNHGGDFLKLSKKEFQDLHQTLQMSMRVLKKAYQPDGFNLGMNHGAVAGAGIPEHLHYHLIPRWKGDLNFFPLIAETKAVIESPEQSFDRLIGFFEEE